VAGHGILQRVEPGGVGAALGEQAVAVGHRRLVAADLGGVGWLQRQHEPVEETAAPAWGLLEQPVHLRGQPDHGEPLGQLGLGAQLLAVQAEGAALRPAFLQAAGADLEAVHRIVEMAADRPGRGAMHRHLGDARPAQPPSGREQADRLQDVGLARSVRPREGDDAAAEPQVGREIGTEPRQAQSGQAGHWRNLTRPPTTVGRRRGFAVPTQCLSSG
jgi:hypothetical protein